MKTCFFICACAFLVVAFSCKKDEGPSACDRMVGIWQVNSWIEESVQLLGETGSILSSDINFKTLTDGHGDFEWNVDYALTGPESTIGGYDVNADCNQVTITPKGFSDGDVYDFHFDGDVLILEGTVNGQLREIRLIK